MNVTETIFALALASNLDPAHHFQWAYRHIQTLGRVQFSPIYEIPCRHGIGANYWNSACLLTTHLTQYELEMQLKWMEQQAGRVRPSNCISLDIDLIAWGNSLNHMLFNAKKQPLPLDVKAPLYALWQHPSLVISSTQRDLLSKVHLHS